MRTVWITGATSGIGLATVHALAETNKYRILISGRRIDRLHAVAEELKSSGIEAWPVALDVRSHEAITGAVENLPHDWAEIDILINNAGLAKGLSPIHEGTIEHWEQMIDTNLKGLLYMTRQIAPGMVQRGAGHILNVASTAGKEVYPMGNVYCATKHAVDALTRAMRIDLHGHGIKVSQVAPAHVEETEFANVRFDGDVNRANIYSDFNPLKSSDVASAIRFILEQPAHVCVQDIVLMGTQQANSLLIDRSGRKYD